jgi:hypothetical protein
MFDENAAEAAFLEQLDRKRTDMMREVHSAKRGHKPARKSPPVLALEMPAQVEQQPSLSDQSLIESQREHELEELEMQWARSRCILRPSLAGSAHSRLAILFPAH